MKKVILFAAFVAVMWLWSGCGESAQVSAEKRLVSARVAFAKGDYQKAKLQLDSLKILYPKAFKQRREALALLRQVELSEQQRSLHFYDSLRVVQQACIDSLLTCFEFEKNVKYQDVGHYMVSSQSPAKNPSLTYLRGQVDELGQMTLSSIYKGKAMAHKSVRLEVGDNFTEAVEPLNQYSSNHLGVTTERLDFRLGRDGGAIGFIALNKENAIKVTLEGKSKFSYTLRREDAEAIARLYNLSSMMLSVKEVEKSLEEAQRHIDFILRSVERGEAGELTDSLPRK